MFPGTNYYDSKNLTFTVTILSLGLFKYTKMNIVMMFFPSGMLARICCTGFTTEIGCINGINRDPRIKIH